MYLGTNIIVLVCPMYTELRKKYLPVPKYYRRCSNMLKFVELMSSKKINTITKLADFTHKAFQIRNDVEYDAKFYVYLLIYIYTYLQLYLICYNDNTVILLIAIPDVYINWLLYNNICCEFYLYIYMYMYMTQRLQAYCLKILYSKYVKNGQYLGKKHFYQLPNYKGQQK